MEETLREPQATAMGETACEQARTGLPLAQRVRQWQAAAMRGLAPLQAGAERLQRRWDAATVGGRQVINPLNFLAVAAVVGVTAVVGTVYTPSYMVTLDGLPLGTVQNQQVFEQVIERVENRATKILGHDYALPGTVDYHFALSERGELTPTAEFETYLFDRIGEVMKSYVLKVDGKFIGAATDRESIATMLEAIKAPYMTENTVVSEFTSNVIISHEYTASDVQQDLVAMEQLLTANTTGETTYEVQKGDTFMQLANDNGMTMKELEALNPGVDVNKLQIGQLLNVREVVPYLSVRTVESISYTEAIACPVEKIQDNTMYQGDTKVLEEGLPGQQLVAAEVSYVNGREEGRTISSTQVLSAPTTRVVAEGTKERPKTMPKGYFIWPVYGRITSYFGYRSIFGSYSYHGGIDIANSYGAGIVAADGGTVVFAGRATGSNWSYGNLVIIDHGNGIQSYYGHCSSVLVSKGDKVYQGQTIARVGSTGRSTGNHCHFEVKIGGTSVNPLSYLD